VGATSTAYWEKMLVLSLSTKTYALPPPACFGAPISATVDAIAKTDPKLAVLSPSGTASVRRVPGYLKNLT
jgi:hypothetical protein